MKKFIVFCVVGLAIGNFAATFFGPSLLTWWFQPPVDTPINCTVPITWAMQRLITLQMIGSGIGLFFGLVLSFFLFKEKKTQPTV
jgi:hypothetical protein